MYLGCLLLHRLVCASLAQVTELHDDLFNIPAKYQEDANTGFWVAEVHDATESSELSAHFNVANKVRRRGRLKAT